MDLYSLIGGLQPVAEVDRPRKTAALQFALTSLGQDSVLSLAAFEAGLPTAITARRLGSDAEDFYLTALLAAAAWRNEKLDVLAGAVLQHITLQLNFMTRFIAEPRGPECVVVEANQDIFHLGLANHNVVGGILVAEEEPSRPDWIGLSQIAKFREERLSYSTIDELPDAFNRLGLERVGCLLVEVPVNRSIDLADRYVALRSRVAEDTFFVFYGAATVVLEIVEKLEAINPNAVILSRLYEHCANGLTEQRAIVVAVGLDKLPEITIGGSGSVACRRLPRSQSDSVCDVPYFLNAEGASHEWVSIKRPTAICAQIPLPEEARQRISDRQLFPHAATSLRGGMLIPWQSFNCNTFLHVTGRNELITDIGEGNIHFAPDVAIDAEGYENCVLPAERVMRVGGAAMPLTFTPGLHSFFSHFLLQCFPRVCILRDIDSDAKIIVDAEIRPKQIEMLRRVGFGEDRVVRRPKGVVIRADELIVPQPWPLVFSPYTLSIYDELIASAAAPTMPKGRRILISREYRSTWRSMLTYPAVAAMLMERYGFEEVRPENLTLDEEIHLYKDASIVIGAEGAGLYGAVYAGAGSTYVSVGDEDYIMPVLGSAASVRGFDVAYVFGESLRATSDVRRRLASGHSDYMVDPQAVARLLDEIIG